MPSSLTPQEEFLSVNLPICDFLPDYICGEPSRDIISGNALYSQSSNRIKRCMEIFTNIQSSLETNEKADHKHMCQITGKTSNLRENLARF